MNDTKRATVYRMVMPDHVCPYGLKTVDLLKRQGYAVDDHHLTTRAETDAFITLSNSTEDRRKSICRPA